MSVVIEFSSFVSSYPGDFSRSDCRLLKCIIGDLGPANIKLVVAARLKFFFLNDFYSLTLG